MTALKTILTLCLFLVAATVSADSISGVNGTASKDSTGIWRHDKTGGVNGSTMVGGTSAFDSQISGNPLLMGCTSSTDGSLPSNVSAASEAAFVICRRNGLLLTQNDHPARFRCIVNASAAVVLTAFGGSCGAQGAGFSHYVTDILFSASAAGAVGADTAPTLKYGTGGACGTGTTTFWTSFNVLNTPVIQTFAMPIKIPANNEICWIMTTASTKRIVINGFINQDS